jgi:hypothetical protein
MADANALLIADFRNFLYLVWQHLGLPEPTLLQYDIAWYLQHGPRRRIIEAFRGCGKSWITAAFVLWKLYCNPNERILVVSASKDRADAFSVFVKRLIEEMPLLHHLKPRPGQRDSNLAFDVGPSDAHQAPSVRSVGITGQLTGGRATLIVADDVEIPKNSLTHLMRARLAELVKEFDAVLSPGGDIVYLGTPQCEMSLYNVLPPRGYDMRIWPARYPSREKAERYGIRLAPMIRERLTEIEAMIPMGDRGAPTDPQRFTDLDLLEREGSYGRSGFAMQFMLDTSVSDENRYPLKLSDLIIMGLDLKQGPVSVVYGSSTQQIINDLPNVGLQGDRLHRPMAVSPEFKEYQGIVMAVDPSGRGGDELSYAIVALLNGWLYVLTVKGLVGGYKDENLQKLADEAKKYGVRHIIVEENFGDGMFTKLLTPFLTRTYPCTTEEVKHSIQKERRIIDTLEPLLNQHRVVIDEKLIREDAENYNGHPDDHERDYQLFYQMTRVTKERGALAHDDRLDVLAMACKYWVDVMDKDTQKADAEHRAALLEAELRDFHQHVVGMSPAQETWM